MIIDTHTHVVSADEHTYPLQCTVTDRNDPSSWPLVARVTVEELAEEMSASGVDAACLVQGYAAYRFDNRYAVKAAEDYAEDNVEHNTEDNAGDNAERFVSVCAVDTQDPQAPAQLEALARNPRMRGVRLVSGFMEGDPGLGSPSAQRVWDAADQLDLVVVAFTLGDQLEGFAAAARSHSERPVILDHCGFVDVIEDFDRLEGLAALENVYLKVSTRVLVQSDPVRILDRLANHFGAERLLWGSDYPASHDRSYREWVALANASTQNLSQAQAERFMAGTALELWPEFASA